MWICYFLGVYFGNSNQFNLNIFDTEIVITFCFAYLPLVYVLYTILMLFYPFEFQVLIHIIRVQTSSILFQSLLFIWLVFSTSFRIIRYYIFPSFTLELSLVFPVIFSCPL